MYQVGDQKTFVVQGTPSAGTLAYVFKWQWDSTVSVTTNGTATKTLNLGGNPADSFNLRHRVDICDQFGNSQALNGSIVVNNPPSLQCAPTITPNDRPFPFQTIIDTRAYDLEEAGAVGFFWYNGTIPIPSGVTSTIGTAAGTYAGTLTSAKTVYRNVLTRTVDSGTVLTCRIVDANSGTTIVPYRLNGYDPADPSFSVAAQPDSLTANASTLPSQTIGSQPITFSAFAADTSSGSLAFYWAFYGSNGWTANVPFYSTGTNTTLPTGVRSDVQRDISDEDTTGLRTAQVTVTNVSTGRSVTSSIDVKLIKNEAPDIDSVGLRNAQTGAELTDTIDRSSADPFYVRLTGSATDANDDLLVFRWDLTLPVQPTPITLYGREIVLDMGPYGAGDINLGTLVVSDRLGLTSPTYTIPQITIED
jgi:hypothetical protein